MKRFFVPVIVFVAALAFAGEDSPVYFEDTIPAEEERMPLSFFSYNNVGMGVSLFFPTGSQLDSYADSPAGFVMNGTFGWKHFRISMDGHLNFLVRNYQGALPTNVTEFGATYASFSLGARICFPLRMGNGPIVFDPFVGGGVVFQEFQENYEYLQTNNYYASFGNTSYEVVAGVKLHFNELGGLTIQCAYTPFVDGPNNTDLGGFRVSTTIDMLAIFGTMLAEVMYE